MVELRKKISDKKLKIEVKMKYLHTMVRVKNIEESIDFYCNKLGLKEVDVRKVKKEDLRLFFLELKIVMKKLVYLN